jgi:uncharacterized protein (DUF4415 family)
MVEFEWDPDKAASNLRKHRVRFADEDRFAAVGMDSLGKDSCGDLRSSRRSNQNHFSAQSYEAGAIAVSAKTQMKREYDFSKAKRGPVVPAAPEKTRVTIRLDNDVIEHFQNIVDRAGGGNYQTMINAALREYIQGSRLEAVVRRAVRREVEAVRAAIARTG